MSRTKRGHTARDDRRAVRRTIAKIQDHWRAGSEAPAALLLELASTRRRLQARAQAREVRAVILWRDLKPGARVIWHGFDGNRYDARVVKVRRRGAVARLDYRHPRTGETVSAYVAPHHLDRMEVQP